VRKAVARNPNTPSNTLAKLAEDEYDGVLRAVAENPNTPSDTLAKLAKDEYDGVRMAFRLNSPNSHVFWMLSLKTQTPNVCKFFLIIINNKFLFDCFVFLLLYFLRLFILTLYVRIGDNLNKISSYNQID